MTLTDSRINKLIERREKETNRIDGMTDWDVVNLVDAQLIDVPPGQRNDVDKLLGRTCAVLDERAEYQMQPNSTQAEIDRQQRIYEQLAAVKGAWSTATSEQTERDEWLTRIMDQHGDWLDFLRLCGDLAI